MEAYLSDKGRRIVGFLVGAAFGLVFSLVSSYINVWSLPGIPLYDPPVGRTESVILSTLVLGLLSVIVVWEEESLFGLIIAALLGVVLNSIQAYLNSGESQVLKSLIVFLFTFLPRVVLFIPLGLFFRWLTNRLEDAILIARGRLRNFGMAVILLVAVAVFGGRFSVLQEEALTSLRLANDLVLNAMPIEDRASLPLELQAVDGFMELAEGPYTLEWSSDPDRLPVQRPRVSVNVLESLVIYRFENGFIFGCVFTPPSYKAGCANISRVPIQ